MGSKHQRWFKWEEDVQEALDLQAMPGSGNQWHAPSDGATVGHWTDTVWPVMVDAKHTVKGSYSLARKLMDQWVTTAAENGKRFALPIRFETVDDTMATRSDYVVIPFGDYAELVAIARDKAPVQEHPKLTSEDVAFVTKVANAISNTSAQRKLMAILAKLEG